LFIWQHRAKGAEPIIMVKKLKKLKKNLYISSTLQTIIEPYLVCNLGNCVLSYMCLILTWKWNFAVCQTSNSGSE
jgi:hypothetical protein